MIAKRDNNRRNWTYSEFASERFGAWVGYKLDPIKKSEGKTIYIAGAIRSNGKIMANTRIGLGQTPEFAIEEFLRSNGMPISETAQKNLARLL
ncbi:hypothetical protein CN878_20260 [Ochrobactrum sp. 695/2009]|nr:hypothetical protein [Brucella intermedia]PJR90012.1 hypothetical protein CN881_12520 [Ochrobactrum sp. 721/2009]PJT16699.1 hypothetical protein CN880_10215 [Ochrobactrum sp. 720/2009]PJT26521.1 hypothetical protein CN879_06180 [Ochrobactrum sp. 715/2009]PJT26788.1 hypothetical protein CN878_20260 [Ochrobactrum sp. 695/2009]PJT36041.1 hypothetical protein CN877_08625 [Ochrobactrum sp. 689/2009]